MNGYRDSKNSEVAYISEYVCAEWNDENECDFVGRDIEVRGGSDYVVGDTERFSQDTFYVDDDFKCPKCSHTIRFLELKV